MTDRTNQTQQPIAPSTRIGSIRRNLHTCNCGDTLSATLDPYVDAYGTQHEYEMGDTPCGPPCDYIGRGKGRVPIDLNVVKPGDLCADYDCTTIHPGISHATYCTEFVDL